MVERFFPGRIQIAGRRAARRHNGALYLFPIMTSVFFVAFCGRVFDLLLLRGGHWWHSRVPCVCWCVRKTRGRNAINSLALLRLHSRGRGNLAKYSSASHKSL